MSIRTEKLTKSYHGGIRGLVDLDLDIPGGGIFGLLGRNGAGKSTLLRILTTLIRPTAGRAEICGLDTGRQGREIRRLIGYLPQRFGVYPDLSAYEFLDYMAHLYGMKDPRERRTAILSSLEAVHLEGVRDRRLGTFSGGMVQRIGIAQALLNSPRILIVDEPTANLDPEERVAFRNVLAESAAERTVLISTHIVSDVESMCNGLAILADGRLLYAGAPATLLAGVAGRVRELRLPAEDVAEIRKDHAIVSAVREGREVKLRLICRQESPPGHQVTPSLEDAYIHLMSGSR